MGGCVSTQSENVGFYEENMDSQEDNPQTPVFYEKKATGITTESPFANTSPEMASPVVDGTIQFDDQRLRTFFSRAKLANATDKTTIPVQLLLIKKDTQLTHSQQLDCTLLVNDPINNLIPILEQNMSQLMPHLCQPCRLSPHLKLYHGKSGEELDETYRFRDMVTDHTDILIQALITFSISGIYDSSNYMDSRMPTFSAACSSNDDAVQWSLLPHQTLLSVVIEIVKLAEQHSHKCFLPSWVTITTMNRESVSINTPISELSNKLWNGSSLIFQRSADAPSLQNTYQMHLDVCKSQTNGVSRMNSSEAGSGMDEISRGGSNRSNRGGGGSIISDDSAVTIDDFTIRVPSVGSTVLDLYYIVANKLQISFIDDCATKVTNGLQLSIVGDKKHKCTVIDFVTNPLQLLRDLSIMEGTVLEYSQQFIS